MSTSFTFFGASFTTRLLFPLALLSGCLGGRTPLDDAGTTIAPDLLSDGAMDSWEAGPYGDVSDSVAPVCGITTTIDTSVVRADVMILLDRSDSMNWSLNSTEDCTADYSHCRSRADALLPALDATVTANPDINWGLELFPYPDDPVCSVSSTPQVDIGSDTAAAIQAQLASFTTGSSTPTAAAIDTATAYLATLHDDRSKAILLATDGLPTCGKGRSPTVGQMLVDAIDSAAAAYQTGFPVYVIGIGNEESNLDRLAQGGGTGHYYPASSTTELNDALQSIARVVSRTCTFKADTVPPDQALVTVWVDGSPVARDEGDGWMFESADATGSTIVLTGSYCESMQAGDVAQVRITCGCPDL